MTSKPHWENIYATKSAREVSWYQEHAEQSLRMIRDADTPLSASLIDVGGGASTLADDLLAAGFQSVTVLDLSGAALAKAKERLGDRASGIRWLEANVLTADLPPQGFDVWHDRAVFHFLTQREERRAYVDKVVHAVKPGGLVIIATFAEDGPTKCSGLPVVRYDPSALHAELGRSFSLEAHEKETHRTPAGNEQKFVYCAFRLVAGA